MVFVSVHYVIAVVAVDVVVGSRAVFGAELVAMIVRVRVTVFSLLLKMTMSHHSLIYYCFCCRVLPVLLLCSGESSLLLLLVSVSSSSSSSWD